jgi:EpsD family peptidyl-prolyl cis-trans isomerase
MLAPISAKPLALLIVALFAGSLAGCGDSSEAKPAATQVAAKVNDAEISVHEINSVLSKASGVTNENAARARKEILDRLIDQQLAVEQAMKAKLDRNPDVMMSVEAAKREVLARAYLQQLAAAQPKPADEEVTRYFDEHPDLFAGRKVYNIQELVIPKAGIAPDTLRQAVSTARSMDEIAAWLKANNVPARGNAGSRAAEQMPIELLPKIAALKDGQIAMIEAPQAIYVMRVAASQAAPINLDAARPRIQLFLANQRNNKAVADEIKRLKEAAKIELVGDFATAAAETPKAAFEAPAEPKSALDDNAQNAALEKGISRLK